MLKNLEAKGQATKILVPGELAVHPPLSYGATYPRRLSFGRSSVGLFRKAGRPRQRGERTDLMPRLRTFLRNVFRFSPKSSAALI